jgi:AraC family transcriptional regulator
LVAKIDALFGETLACRRVGGFKLAERTYPPRFKTPKHAHKWPFMCLVLEGAYTLNVGDRSWLCKPPMLMFYGQAEVHWERFEDRGARLFIIEMDPRWFRRVKKQARLEPVLADFPGGIVTALSRRLYKEFLVGDRISALVVEGLVLEIVGEAVRFRDDPGSSYAPVWLQKAREILSTRFTEPLTIEQVAGIVRVHPVHLAQMFRKHYHCTAGAYIRKLRVEFAVRQLAGTDLPLVDIALAAGFCDQSHFTKTFRQYTGLVPSQFRKSLR